MTTPDTVFSPQLAPRPAVAPGPPERFTGDVLVGAVVEGPGEPWAVYEVHFEAGARTVWHQHVGEQLLVGLTGVCVVQFDGKPAHALVPGEAIRIPPGVRHWHGAGRRIAASHLALNAPGPTAWGTAVTPQEYALAAGVEGA
jgi:quercetin dioxygenase-like cupin family protein